MQKLNVTFSSQSFGIFLQLHPLCRFKISLVQFSLKTQPQKTIRGRVNRAFATEALDSDLIPDRVKPKTINIGVHSFPA